MTISHFINRNLLLVLTLVTLICITLIACESSVVKPEEAIANHPEWDAQTILYIREGMLLEGMTKEQVLASWGKYCQNCPATKKFDWGETWEYATKVVFFDKSGQVSKFVKK